MTPLIAEIKSLKMPDLGIKLNPSLVLLCTFVKLFDRFKISSNQNKRWIFFGEYADYLHSPWIRRFIKIHLKRHIKFLEPVSDIAKFNIWEATHTQTQLNK